MTNTSEKQERGAYGRQMPASERWIKPPRLYEEIARVLTEAVVQGRLVPGEFLPTEQEIANEYGASRNVVREALKLLMARGLIEMLHGRGSRVLAHHHWQLRDQLVRLMRENPRVPRDLLDIRWFLEPEIAFLAAKNATDEQIEAMREAVTRLQEATDQSEAAIEHDSQFHRLLAEATGNALLPLVLQPVDGMIYASRVATVEIPGAVERSIQAHIAILDRVAAHDSDGSRQAMRDHLSQVEIEIPQIARTLE
jgi:DNA-binding FadR family transcriptional regulator